MTELFEPTDDDLREEAADAAVDALTIIGEYTYGPPIGTLIDWAEDRGVDRELIARLQAAADAISTVASDAPAAVLDLIEATQLQQCQAYLEYEQRRKEEDREYQRKVDAATEAARKRLGRPPDWWEIDPWENEVDPF